MILFLPAAGCRGFAADRNSQMEFTYTYKVKPTDLWQVRMYYAYASYLAMVNIVAIFASIALLIAFWKNGAPWVRLVLLLFLSLFTVIQPLYIYYDCKRQLGNRGELELTLTFNGDGLTILTGGKREKHPWKDIINVSVKPTLVVIYTGQSQGYILTNRVLGETRGDFLALLRENRQLQ